MTTAVLPELESHPHAQAVLGGALSGELEPSHAYLFTGPGSSQKRSGAISFATELMLRPDEDRSVLAARIERGTHPDLTWITPSGAHEMLRADIDEPVVSAATYTPFEATKRVFVIERAETMNDEAANRLLKTLEEPPEYVHLVLIADRVEDVLPTIRSRCQVVRFEPLAADEIESVLVRGGVEAAVAQATAQLAQGDLDLAERLTSELGMKLRSAALKFALAPLHGTVSREKAWVELLSLAKAAGDVASSSVEEQLKQHLELTAKKDKKKVETEAADRAKRAKRRGETDTLDLGLWLINSIFRDLIALKVAADDRLWNTNLTLNEVVTDQPNPVALSSAIALVEETRSALQLNVGAELALEALSYRLELFLAKGK